MILGIRPICWTTSFVSLLAALHGHAAPSVRVSVEKTAIGAGESVVLTSKVSTGYLATRSDHRIIPFVNGKRWGAIEVTNADGVTVHHLPLPNVGPARIEVLAEAPLTRHKRAEWIWGDTRSDRSTHYFQRVFTYEGDPEAAQLRVAVDDYAVLYLNGEEVGTVEGWRETPPVAGLAEYLVPGENVLSVAASNTGGLAGLLVRLDAGADRDSPVVISGADWSYFPIAPYGWPFRAEVDGQNPRVLGDARWSPYRPSMGDWPTLPETAFDMVGTPKPDAGVFSSPVTVDVAPRALERPPGGDSTRIGIQFSPCFTPGNITWYSAHAVPLTGRYWSWNRDVQRQQLIWLIESGVDFLVLDWTNHLWDRVSWANRPDRANEIIHATTTLLETLATMRDEGHPVPGVVLYLGLNNGASTTVAAIEEGMAWIHHTYVRNPRFDGLFETYGGKPLLLLHNGDGPEWKDSAGESAPDDNHFTVRHQSYHHDLNDHGSAGFWSWMDGTPDPVPTVRGESVEALTVSAACYGPDGWLGEGANARRGGLTLLEGFRKARESRPRFLQVHQYQAFFGQWEGFGYGPDGDIYMDAYNVLLSDDIEPVSLTAHAYRGNGGWGFYYLNLLRALVDVYRQVEPETTVLVLSEPAQGAELSGETARIAWDWLGREPGAVELRVNGAVVRHESGSKGHVLDLTPYAPGPLSITVTAPESAARYPLSYTEAMAPLKSMKPAKATVDCVVARD